MRPTILCVDDEPVVLDSLKEQFRRIFGARYAIEVAQDAEEALELVEELTDEGVALPVVISDHIMPGMKGDELLIKLSGRLPHVRTILLTGQASAGAVGRVVNEGSLYRYIAKPWDRADLELTVREAIRSYDADARVREQREALVQAHRASQRFVPHAFLSLLGRENLTEVERTDHVEQEVSIFFSDLRSFTTLVEARSPAENLAWINEYFERMEVPIHHNRGFVDSIEGDAILALFGGSADDAVHAGIQTQQALSEYNVVRRARGDEALRAGIGINTGSVLLGVIGGADRLKCGVVGDPVNLAARVEGLTRHLGTMLITGHTLDRLADPSAYQLRYVTRVTVKGRRSQTDLYEVLDGLPAQVREERLRTREQVQGAIDTYQAGDIQGAVHQFERIPAPRDPLVRWYLALCQDFTERGLPTGWDGTTHLERK